jgi:Xaa-Pro aminopeptidase
MPSTRAACRPRGAPGERISGLQAALREDGLAAALVTHSRDLLYYTGTAQPGCLVVLPEDYRLFVRSGLSFAARESWLPPGRLVFERRLDAVLQGPFWGRTPRGGVGVAMDVVSARQAREMVRLLNGRELVDVSPRILAQRMIKSREEIRLVERACAAVHAGHEAALAALHPGVTELELAAAVERAHRLAGHEGDFFMRQIDFFMSRGPLASGPNLREISGVALTITGRGLSAAVPAGPSRRRIRSGECVLIDIPTCVEGYHADQTRTYFLGRPPGEIPYLYERLRDVEDGLLAGLRPGLTCGEVYHMATSLARGLGVGEGFLRFPSGSRAHFVGHGIGLELNEPPLVCKGSQERLEEGMVLALEIHLMSPRGHVLKLEDMVCVEAGGCRLLSRTPRDLTKVSVF